MPTVRIIDVCIHKRSSIIRDRRSFSCVQFSLKWHLLSELLLIAWTSRVPGSLSSAGKSPQRPSGLGVPLGVHISRAPHTKLCRDHHFPMMVHTGPKPHPAVSMLTIISSLKQQKKKKNPKNNNKIHCSCFVQAVSLGLVSCTVSLRGSSGRKAVVAALRVYHQALTTSHSFFGECSLCSGDFRSC